jgi:hypothetical protein
MHGFIEGKAAAIGLTPRNQIALDAATEEVVATAAIEGERLSLDTVRSSVMRRQQVEVRWRWRKSALFCRPGRGFHES